MPASHHVYISRKPFIATLVHPSTGESAASLIQSVKEQEVQFDELARELEAERQSVAHQIERCHFSSESAGMSMSRVGVHDSLDNNTSYHWSSLGDNADLSFHVSGSQLVDSCLRVLQEKEASDMPQYQPYSVNYYAGDASIPETDANSTSYSSANVTYRPTSSPAPSQQHSHQPHQQPSQQIYQQSPSAANGHAGAGGGRDNIPSPNSSQLSLHSSEGHPQLISRTTQRNSTQQVTTVTKVIRQRELRHIGPDGQPIDYTGVYGSNHPPPPPPGSDYSPYGYSGVADPSRAIGRATSPGSHEVPHHQDYLNYGGRPHSPSGETGSHRNYDTYASPHRTNYQHEYDSYQHHAPPKGSRPSDYAIYQRSEAPPPGPNVPPGYGNYSTLPRDPDRPTSPPSLPSEASGSPVTQRVMLPPGHNAVGPGGPVPNVNAAGGMVSPRGLPSYPTSGYDELDNTLGPRTTPRSPDLHDAYQGHPPHPGHYDVTWRDPDLPEVIDFLSHPNNVVKANAAAYLQHLCYMDDHTKQKTRGLGGIPLLVSLLNNDIPEVHRNACGALRNLSYGRQNDENKRAIKNAGGIASLVRLLRKTPDNEVRELVTGVLWNMSSCEDLKKPIIDEALTVITNNVVIPHSGWDRNLDSDESPKPNEIYWSTVFRNASGVLRNVSSAGEYARKKLRECEGLVDALFYLVKAAIGKSDIDNKSVENCVCVLRNLSYRCQEVDDPNYDRHELQTQSRAGVPAKGEPSYLGDNLGCFGGSKKKKEVQNTEKQHKEGASASPRPRTDPVKGMEMLWQPKVVQPYLSLLSDCSNPETLEAAAGAIQNLAACYWQPSVDIRAAVRKEKGLPILVELLRMEVDRVVCAVATALRNLALDQRNKELIGKYAMGDLVQKMPSETQQYDTGTSDETIAAVLATLNEVIRRNAEFARTFFETGGIERLMYISRQRVKFSPKVVKFSSQVLYNLWQHQELRESYKKHGWKENNFVTRTMAARSLSPANAHNTLNRPMSSQGGTKYEDKTLQRGHELNAGSGAQGLSAAQPHVGRSPEHVPYAGPEEVPMMDMNYTQDHMHGAVPSSHRPPVNREKKKSRHFDDSQSAGDHWDYEHQQQSQHVQQQQKPMQLVLDGHGNGGPGGDAQAGGDSWV